jgi:hypothetical protein
VDARHKAGHDESEFMQVGMTRLAGLFEQQAL